MRTGNRGADREGLSNCHKRRSAHRGGKKKKRRDRRVAKKKEDGGGPTKGMRRRQLRSVLNLHRTGRSGQEERATTFRKLTALWKGRSGKGDNAGEIHEKFSPVQKGSYSPKQANREREKVTLLLG